MNEEHMLEYNEEQFPQEEFDKATLKMLDAVCEGVEVPTDEESNESAREHHGDVDPDDPRQTITLISGESSRRGQFRTKEGQ